MDGTDVGIIQTSGNEGYEYATAETLEMSNFNWSIINKDVKLIANFKLDSKADVSLGLTVPVKAKVNAKVQIKTSFSLKKGISLKKFDTGVYGGFAFKPDLTLKVGGSCTLPKDKFRHIATMEDMGILYVVMIDSVRILGIHQYFYYYYTSTPAEITPVLPQEYRGTQS